MKEHQRQDWKTHKGVCAKAAANTKVGEKGGEKVEKGEKSDLKKGSTESKEEFLTRSMKAMNMQYTYNNNNNKNENLLVLLHGLGDTEANCINRKRRGKTKRKQKKNTQIQKKEKKKENTHLKIFIYETF
jgi:hypothetical protein